MLLPLVARNAWPDTVDRSAVLLFLAVVVLVPSSDTGSQSLICAAGRARLRGVLVRVARPFAAPLPDWVDRETPPCLRALGLSLPCNEADVKEAYRRRAEALHPDRGGDMRRFLLLQQQLEQSLYFLRQRNRR